MIFVVLSSSLFGGSFPCLDPCLFPYVPAASTHAWSIFLCNGNVAPHFSRTLKHLIKTVTSYVADFAFEIVLWLF